MHLNRANQIQNERMEEQSKSNYSADNIQVLEGLEAVRKRPAMYIGDVGVKGLHHLVYEVVDNSIDEALAGHCSAINVFINKDNSITVRDDGRGIPTAIHTKEKRSALEVVMTVLHAGGKFDKDTYKVSGGLHGVGVSCVNALSIDLKATVFREGKIFVQEYKCGKPQYDVKVIGETTENGTEVTFLPDRDIFEVTEYNYDTLAARMRELAFLNKGIRIELTDRRNQDEKGADIEVLVHRGHSFYVPRSLLFLRNETRIVLLGSCGGYHRVSEILNQSPFAHIISTKQIGTYTVNNPLLLAIAKQVESGGTIQWNEFWEQFSSSFQEGTYAYQKMIEYVPPHQNLGATFIQAFRKNLQLDK